MKQQLYYLTYHYSLVNVTAVVVIAEIVIEGAIIARVAIVVVLEFITAAISIKSGAISNFEHL